MKTCLQIAGNMQEVRAFEIRQDNVFCLLVCLPFGPHRVMLRVCCWLCIQELLPVVLRGLYKMLEIKPGKSLTHCPITSAPNTMSR